MVDEEIVQNCMSSLGANAAAACLRPPSPGPLPPPPGTQGSLGATAATAYEFRAGDWCGSVLVCGCRKESDQSDKATGSDDYLVLFDDFASELHHWSINCVFPEAYGHYYVLCVGADRFLAAAVGEFCGNPCSGVSEWNLQGELQRIVRLSWDPPVLAELEHEDVDLLFSGGDLSTDAQVVVAGESDNEGL